MPFSPCAAHCFDTSQLQVSFMNILKFHDSDLSAVIAQRILILTQLQRPLGLQDAHIFEPAG